MHAEMLADTEGEQENIDQYGVQTDGADGGFPQAPQD